MSTSANPPADTVAFTPERLSKFKALVAKYERKQSALLPTLYLAQDQFGWLSRPVMDYVASLIEVPPRHVYEVAMFYTMFRKKDMGQWCLQVCNNITCTMMGSEDLLKVIHEELGIRPDEVTPDRQFSCMVVQCLGSCDTAPVCQVNEEYVEKLDPDKFRTLIRKLREGQGLAREGEGVRA